MVAGFATVTRNGEITTVSICDGRSSYLVLQEAAGWTRKRHLTKSSNEKKKKKEKKRITPEGEVVKDYRFSSVRGKAFPR